jgi:hypothetical protein
MRSSRCDASDRAAITLTALTASRRPVVITDRLDPLPVPTRHLIRRNTMSEQLATQPARPRGLVVTGGLIGTAAVAAVLNAVVATAAHALGASHDFQPLQPSAYVPFTVFGVLAAAAAWAIIRARSTRPARVLRVLVPAVVLVSLVPDIMVGATAGQPGTSWGAVVALVVMHLVVAAVAVPAYQRLLPLPTAQN